MRLGASARRLMSLAVICTASTWWLGAGLARAATAPSNVTPPAIAGTPQQGDVLTADPGTWSGDAPITYSYQWSDGQSGQAITLTAADVDQSLTVTVTASNAAGAVPATSASFGPVLPAAPTIGSAPTLTGIPQQGDTLSVSPGTWNNNPSAFMYAWEDCTDSSATTCSTISGATSSTYTLQASDVKSTIVATVTASNPGGSQPATSGALGPVLPAPPALGSAPALTGTPQQGDTLSVSTGTWSNNPTGYSYLWEDCIDGSATSCSTIPGATSSTYVLQASDVGNTVLAQVTASNAGGHAAAQSGTLGPVLPAAPVGVKAPAITGVVQQGNAVTVSNGTWRNGTSGFAYTWED